MSRRRNPDYRHVILDVECPKGHRVGVVTKLVAPNPRAGTYQVGLPLRLEAPSDDPRSSGRVRGVCSECGADVQVSWGRAKRLLDETEARGRNTGALR